MHSGLAIVFRTICSKCNQIFSISTLPRVTTQNGKQWSVNLGAVLAQMATGGGLTRLNTTLARLDVPGMQRGMFSATELLLGKEMAVLLATSTETVAVEE
jgi:hypothetical protein